MAVAQVASRRAAPTGHPLPRNCNYFAQKASRSFTHPCILTSWYDTVNFAKRNQGLRVHSM